MIELFKGVKEKEIEPDEIRKDLHELKVWKNKIIF